MAKAKISYQQLRAELDKVLEILESEDLDIDSAEAAYQQGTELIKQLEKYIKAVQNRVKKISPKSS